MIHYSLPVRAVEERRGIFGVVLTQFISVQLVSVVLLVETHKLSYPGSLRIKTARFIAFGRDVPEDSFVRGFEMGLVCVRMCDVELRATLIVFVCGWGADRQASLMDVCPKTTNWLSVNHQ